MPVACAEDFIVTKLLAGRAKDSPGSGVGAAAALEACGVLLPTPA